MSSTEISAAGRSDIAHHLHPYTQLRALEQDGPLVIVKGDGVHVIDEHGRRYLEGMAGLWCASAEFGGSRRPSASCARCPTTTRSRARCQGR
jgi:4-aminobutyrate--pyruvate transaminase